MRCPNCDGTVEIEDPSEEQTFTASCCGARLRYRIDESTYHGATHQTLQILDDEGDE